MVVQLSRSGWKQLLAKLFFFPQQHPLLRRMLPHCFAMKLQKCFVDHKTSHFHWFGGE